MRLSHTLLGPFSDSGGNKVNFVFNFCNIFPSKMVLAGTSIGAVAAVKDLIYTGTCQCHRDEVA